VCRGLYLCARDEDLWRLVCLRYISVESEDLLAMLFLWKKYLCCNKNWQCYCHWLQHSINLTKLFSRIVLHPHLVLWLHRFDNNDLYLWQCNYALWIAYFNEHWRSVETCVFEVCIRRKWGFTGYVISVKETITWSIVLWYCVEYGVSTVEQLISMGLIVTCTYKDRILDLMVCIQSIGLLFCDYCCSWSHFQ